jgi:hypothetical protein
MLINSYRFGGLWTPSQIPTAIWIDASDQSTITTDLGKVSEWRDKSGNNIIFSQSTSGLRPNYVLNYYNNLNTVQFTNGPWMQASYLYSSDQISFFSVHIRTGGGYGRLISMASAPGDDWNTVNGIALLYGVTAGCALYRNSAAIASTSATNSAWCLVDSERSSGTGQIALNGGTYVSGTTNPASHLIQRTRIGNDFAAVDSGLAGHIGEQIVITGAVTSLVRQKLQGYLAWKWALQASLPSDHPYKSAAPTV